MAPLFDSIVNKSVFLSAIGPFPFEFNGSLSDRRVIDEH
jgi:hypothetical protein